jgi:DNA-binding NtrC family response regulator
MIEIYKLIGVLARNRATVLITGATGTGKERIARAIHHSSPHASEPFIGVNCTAIPETLLESELFGHTRGAFTGAVGPRQGYFELAEEGTLFLDEIGDTAPEFQSKLLRVLEEGEFFPVGGERPRQTSARIMAATQTPLEERVREGRFRADLFFRLQVVEIRVPPLRERKEDIPLLAEHFLGKISRELGLEVKGISEAALRALGRYEWPGNIRELEHALTRAAVLSRGSYLGAEHFSLGGTGLDRDVDGPEDRSLEAVEAAHVQRVLHETGGVKRQAVEVLEISRTRLDRIIKKHGLEVPD